MPMRRQPMGVHRFPRGDARPPQAYDIEVDGEHVGWVERLDDGWRSYRDGAWPRKFPGRGAYLAAVEQMAEQHRAAKRTADLTSESVAAAEAAFVEKLPPAVADPFRGDRFADPLAP